MTERNTHYKDGELVSYKLGAVKVEAGNIVALASGYALHAADTAGHLVVGVAQETIDNSGGDAGDLSVLVRRKKVFKFANSSTNALVQANVGTAAYIEDSVTVCNSSATNDVIAGEVIAVESDGVYVMVDQKRPTPVAHIADAKVDYDAADVGAAADIAACLNAITTKQNAILAAIESGKLVLTA